MKISPSRPFRVNRDGQSVQCDGFMIEIYDSKEKKNAVDIIYAPYGYEKQDHRLVIDETAAEIVRYIFKLRLEGKAAVRISRI